MNSTKGVFNKVELIYHRHNFYSEVKSVPKTTILFNELTIVSKGKMIYSINGKKNVVNEGCAIFVPYGSERMRLGNTVADFVSFNFIDENDYSPFKVVIPNVIDDEVISLLKIYDLINENNVGNVNEKLACITNTLLQKISDYYTYPKYNDLTNSIISYLEERIFDNVSLKEIESRVFFTSNYFNKIFKKETNLTVIKYFNKLKLEKAKTLITEQEKTLTEISAFLGFNDYNYFSRLFKKYYKISPIDYKKKFLLLQND